MTEAKFPLKIILEDTKIRQITKSQYEALLLKMKEKQPVMFQGKKTYLKDLSFTYDPLQNYSAELRAFRYS